MLVEILVAASIVVAGALASMSFIHSVNKLSRQTLHNAQASYLSEEATEVARLMRDNSWDNVSAANFPTGVPYYPVFNGTNWVLSQTPTNIGIFTRKIIFHDAYRKDSSAGTKQDDLQIYDETGYSYYYDPNSRSVTVNVTWYEEGTPVTKILSIYLMKI